jgi:ferrochelatase
MLAVAEHYDHFGGKSPINDQNRAIIAALETEFAAQGIKLPIYFGNRNWHPLLPDTLRQMEQDGIERALVYVTSAYSSYSGCRQYRENLSVACETLGPTAPQLDKLRIFFNHPLFVQANVARLQDALAQLPQEQRANGTILFTAHSIPLGMSQGCDYLSQLTETARLVAGELGHTNWKLVFQSRSGPPTQPWLEPDVLDAIRAHHAAGGGPLVIAPIGFLCDHLEVLFDLDVEAKHLCDELGIRMVRAATVGTHPLFVQMIRELVQERLNDSPTRAAIGNFPARPDVCAEGCCLPAQRPSGT